jgi:HEAT repeat protein
MSNLRIVPAVDNLLVRSQSEEVAEATAIAIDKQKDSRVIPALRKAAAGIYDYFLKLTIAEAQLNIGDAEDFSTLINILNQDDSGYTCCKANELLGNKSGRKFRYNPDASVSAKRPALDKMSE